MNPFLVFAVAVVLWICGTVSGKGQYLTETVQHWDAVMGPPSETSHCSSHRNGIVTAKYRTGDIKVSAVFENGVAVRVDLFFDLFQSDWAVEGIQRNVINGAFQTLQIAAGVPIYGEDWFQDNVLHFTVKNTFGHELAVFRVERDRVTMVLSDCIGMYVPYL